MENNSNVTIYGIEAIPVLKCCYSKSRSHRHRKIIKSIIQMCEYHNVKYKEIGQEIYVREKDLEKVVYPSKYVFYKYGKPLNEILKEKGISFAAFHMRLIRNWKIEDALRVKIQKKTKKNSL